MFNTSHIVQPPWVNVKFYNTIKEGGLLKNDVEYGAQIIQTNWCDVNVIDENMSLAKWLLFKWVYEKKSYFQISMVVMFQSTKNYMFWYVLPCGCDIHFLFFHILLVVAYTLHQFVA